MAENTAADAQDSKETPILRMQKMYIKDFSLENPNSPDIFRASQSSEPNVDLNLQLNNRKVGDDHWEVALEINAKVVTKEDNPRVLFILEIEHAAVFFLKNIPEQHMSMVLGVECPTLLFPFTRQIISQISVDGGFMPFLMEPVNFMALFQNAQKNKEGSN
ncbi:MAG: protein-export chaperone SecB [Desulfofustis sp.]|nr:protein-export chaperone SecB [Desulfofustis sp.]MBT8355958.1 protein-export chaperone SecB [Desulfofustis sp.]NNF46114.1 protein-export chaperone SecB [Desulfofustis sp.]NNK14696.1 protein-export chaperone SecB [Desulfofustis sp.]